MKNHSVFLCEAEPIVVRGFEALLAGQPEWTLLGAAGGPGQVQSALCGREPGMVILDHASGPRAAVQLLAELRYLCPESKFVFWYRDVPDSDLVRVMQAGAKGLVKKTAPVEDLLACLRAVAAGESYLDASASPGLRQWRDRRHELRLTPREREIMELVGQGLKNREIAERLSITPGTVKVHLMHVFEKTGARDRYELASRTHHLHAVPREERAMEEVRRTA
jgi:DNA-binding NarL/FixJ family response regulator